MHENKFVFFEEIAKGYKELLAEGKLEDIEDAKKDMRIYEFLATCDTDDLCRLLDSGAFNDIIVAYLGIALIHINTDKPTLAAAVSELRWMFDDTTAKDVYYSWLVRKCQM